MSRLLIAAGLLLVAALAALLLWLRPRTADDIEPATRDEEAEYTSNRTSAARSGPKDVEEVSPEPDLPEAAVDPPVEPARAAPTTFADSKGTVAGRVVLEGRAPTMKPLDLPDSFLVGCCEPGDSFDTTDRRLLLDETYGIANVVVTIEVEGRTAPSPSVEPFLLDQAGCRFEPHVSVIPIGTEVSFRNQDQTPHNLHTFARKNDSFNRTLRPGAEHRQTMEQVDRIEVKCDIHPWMNCWLVVVDAPYFAITDSMGSFEIEDVPAGSHKVKTWHELLGKGAGTATVNGADGESKTIEIRMELKER
jgi:plastocyanin